MATAGRETQGASVRAVENRCYGRAFSMTSGDAITEIRAWLLVGTGAHTMQAFVYDTSGNRLATSTPQSVSSGAAAQVAFSISYTFTATDTFVIGIISQNDPGSNEAYYDAVGAVSYYDADASTSYPPPTTWTGIGTDNNTDDSSIAITYTPASGGSTITPAAGSLALSGAAPTVSVSGNISITPAAAALAIVGAAVTQTLTVPSPSAGALTFEGAAPTVSQTTGATIQPNAGAITLAGASPTVTNTTPGIVIAPASGSLSLAGSAPTVALNNMDIVPTAGALTLAGAAPNVSVTGSSSGGQARNRRRRGMLNMIWGR